MRLIGKLERLEARGGIEPPNRSFADLDNERQSSFEIYDKQDAVVHSGSKTVQRTKALSL